MSQNNEEGLEPKKKSTKKKRRTDSMEPVGESTPTPETVTISTEIPVKEYKCVVKHYPDYFSERIPNTLQIMVCQDGSLNVCAIDHNCAYRVTLSEDEEGSLEVTKKILVAVRDRFGIDLTSEKFKDTLDEVKTENCQLTKLVADRDKTITELEKTIVSLEDKSTTKTQASEDVVDVIALKHAGFDVDEIIKLKEGLS